MVSSSFLLHSDLGRPTTKGLILSILVNKWPLSARKIYNELCKQKPITYPTAYKAIQDLKARQIVIKNEQSYSLSLAWINNLKSFANVAEKYYFKQSEFFKLMQMTDENTYATARQFKTMADLNDFMHNYVEEERESVYSISNHLWFPVFHPKRVIEHSNKLAQYGKKLNAVCAGNSPIDAYCAKYLQKLGGSASIGKTSSKNIDFWVFGDKIVHALYPDSIVDQIEDVYTEHKSLAKVATPGFLKETLFKKTKIPVVIVQSKPMADMLKGNIRAMLVN